MTITNNTSVNVFPNTSFSLTGSPTSSTITVRCADHETFVNVDRIMKHVLRILQEPQPFENIRRNQTERTYTVQQIDYAILHLAPSNERVSSWRNQLARLLPNLISFERAKWPGFSFQFTSDTAAKAFKATLQELKIPTYGSSDPCVVLVMPTNMDRLINELDL